VLEGVRGRGDGRAPFRLGKKVRKPLPGMGGGKKGALAVEELEGLADEG
jgi:hypothetical protein